MPLLSPPEEVGGNEHEGVVVSENMVVETGKVTVRDGGIGMMGSRQIDNQKELFQQQQQQQQPQQ